MIECLKLTKEKLDVNVRLERRDEIARYINALALDAYSRLSCYITSNLKDWLAARQNRTPE
jgi:hypothetical protein